MGGVVVLVWGVVCVIDPLQGSIHILFSTWGSDFFLKITTPGSIHATFSMLDSQWVIHIFWSWGYLFLLSACAGIRKGK